VGNVRIGRDECVYPPPVGLDLDQPCERPLRPKAPCFIAEIHGGWTSRASSVRGMEGLVLRVRLVSGDSMDVTYDDQSAGSEDEVIDHVISTLSKESGVLRCRHGGRLLVLYARGVAAVEVAPRGAVL
jgi:hypothetical protein